MLDEDIPDWEPLGAWPLGLVEPDVMVVLTVSEAKRRERMEDRGLQVTEEEQMLAEGSAERAMVLGALLRLNPSELIRQTSRHRRSWMRSCFGSRDVKSLQVTMA